MKHLLVFVIISLGLCEIVAYGAPRPEKTEDGTLVATIAVPQRQPDNLTLKDIRTAIIKAVVGRKFQIEESREDRVVVSYERTGQGVVFTITYGVKDVKIYARGKIIEKQVRFPSREKEKVEATWPKRWLEALKRDIPLYLSEQMVLAN